MAEQISHNLFDDDDNNDVADDDNLNLKPEFTSDGVLYDIGLLPSFAQDSVGNLFLLSHSDGHIFRLRTADVNYDGTLNAQDIDALAAEAQKPPASRSKWFDLNNDGVVNFVASGDVETDADYLIHTVLNTEYGDATLDGKVDIRDLAQLGRGFKGLGTGWAFGNFDGNANPPNISDLAILGRNYGFMRGSGAFLPFAVPEPSTAALTGFTLILVSSVQFRRRSLDGCVGCGEASR
jgi:hypothetical protein